MDATVGGRSPTSAGRAARADESQVSMQGTRRLLDLLDGDTVASASCSAVPGTANTRKAVEDRAFV
jgi:hypothetical protein